MIGRGSLGLSLGEFLSYSGSFVLIRLGIPVSVRMQEEAHETQDED